MIASSVGSGLRIFSQIHVSGFPAVMQILHIQITIRIYRKVTAACHKLHACHIPAADHLTLFYFTHMIGSELTVIPSAAVQIRGTAQHNSVIRRNLMHFIIFSVVNHILA